MTEGGKIISSYTPPSHEDSPGIEGVKLPKSSSVLFGETNVS